MQALDLTHPGADPKGGLGGSSPPNFLISMLITVAKTQKEVKQLLQPDAATTVI
jgi:hypothetical protein